MLSETILVTGGAGFIGSNFVLDWIAAENSAVLTLDKLSYAGNLRNLAALEGNPRHTFVLGDIGDGQLLATLFEKYQPSAVINFAAETHVDRSIYHPDEFVQTNVLGTATLLKSALTFWQQLPNREQARFRFVQVSTDEVYGSVDKDALSSREGDPYAPNSPYAASKAAADHFVRAYYHTYGLPTLSTYASNNFGPYQFPEKLLPLAIVNALEGKPIPIYGDGLQIRNWLAVEEHCQALRLVLQKGIAGHSYNIGGSAEIANIDLMRMLCDLLDEMVPSSPHRPHSSLIEHVTDRPGHDRRYALDSSKIGSELGWHASRDFKAQLQRTISWYLSNPVWIQEVARGEYRRWVEMHDLHEDKT